MRIAALETIDFFEKLRYICNRYHGDCFRCPLEKCFVGMYLYSDCELKEFIKEVENF